ncbi:MAG: TolC family protein [Spiribacter salinus]|uniref:TolC family protein n=1 Tax=Spiribacter salinus TaxID=1335746 RepID=A0A540VR68_9GAMM|nr:MAG: TolC family protein [Spiribacter salinus]
MSDGKLLRRPRAAGLFFFLSTVVLTGCAVEPAAIDRQAMSLDLIQDRAVAQLDIAPLSGPLSLEEAIARAIKYNLDHRVELMEQAIARGELDLSRYDMLPSLLADAGYSTRSEPRLTRSTNAVTGEELESDPTISADQSSWNVSAELSWSLLDFGASYYEAQQNADRLLIASERRRRAMHLLIMDVQTAYWRAASAQALEGQIEATVQAARAAIEDARRAQRGNAQKPMEHLQQLRALLSTLRDIHQVQQELVASRVELANLINAPIDQPLVLDPATSLENLPQVLDEPMEALERVALYNNADLKEPFYDVEIAALETRRALLDLMPDLSLNWGRQYTTDSYVLNDQWNEGALSLSYNLLSLLKVNDVKDQAEAREELARMRRVAMQMTVVAQVHLAGLQAKNALNRLENAEDLQGVEREIESRMVNQHFAGTISRAELVRAQTAAVVAELQRYQALAGFHAAMGRLQASLGLEPDISSIQTASLDEIEQEVGVTLENWYAGTAVRREISLINQAESVTIQSDTKLPRRDKATGDAEKNGGQGEI